jgi:hypothetical protein
MIHSKNKGEEDIIEEYSLSNWKLKTTFKSPISCTMKQAIYRIQFSSNGSYLGVLLIDGEHGDNEYHWCFQLRRPNNMNILQIVPLDNDRACGLTALSNEQFLANTCQKKDFFLIGSDGKLKEAMHYQLDDARHCISGVLIGAKCLVICTEGPDRLNFYDL